MKLSRALPLLTRICLCLLIAIFLTATDTLAVSNNPSSSDQSTLWHQTEKGGLPGLGRRPLTPEKHLVFRLNPTLLRHFIDQMPLEFTNEARLKNVVIEIPMPDGSLARFRIEESQVLASHLAADFPNWKTFQGYGIDDPSATARFDWTPAGFHGYVLTQKGTVYIDPVQENDKENYLVYYKHEYGRPGAGDFVCGVDDLMSKLAPVAASNAPDVVQFSYGTAIRTYRIAVATTGEWSRGTTMSTDPQTVRTAALAALTTTVNRLDGIFRREIAASFQIVNPAITNDATNILFDDPATDPYDNSDSGAQLTLNQTVIDTRVGLANYDLGHLYGTGGGGVAQSPSLCDTDKAQGYSARAGFYGDPFTVDYVAHEIGHQFGASHTYNNMDNGGACTTRSTSNAFEVASGSTLMSYVGICNIRNLQQYVDTVTPAFHTRSLTQMTAYVQTPAGTCGTPAGTNSVPTVNAGASYTIPRLTPFTLTATGNDADAADVANLLYSWEEYDLSPSGSGQLGTPALTYDVDTDGVLRPLFRAYSPVASTSRTFPSMTFILNPANNNPVGGNNPPLTYQGAHPTSASGATCQPMTECVVGENLPSAARTMNFRVAIRDGHGGIADAGMTVTTAAGTGPFRVTAQDTAAAWPAGSTQTVTWDVAGTDTAPVGAANVTVRLSTDGGQTFPTTLLANTPNDGTEQITVPNSPTTQARLKVQAVGNIFFDINNVDFAITAGGGPSVAVGDASAGERGVGLNRPSGEGTIDFPITLSAPSAQTVTVQVSTNGITATEGGDFISLDHVEVVFPPNTTTRTVSVPTIEDPGDEPDETFSLDVDSVSNASVGDGQGIGTIIDDDPAPASVVQFSAATYKDDESQSVVVTATRTGATTGVSTVTFGTAGGNATGGVTCVPGADYPTTTQTVTFPAGSTAPQTVSIPLCRDTLLDTNETFNVTLSNPNAGTGIGAQGTAVVTINDTANQFLNADPISIIGGAAASAYPAPIVVSGATTNVFRMRVTLYDFYHALPDNVEVLLVGPNGGKYVLMGDVGGPAPIVDGANVTLTLGDFYAGLLSDGGPLTTGGFKPTTCGTTPMTAFPAPAPVLPYAEPGCTTIRPNAQTLYGNFGQATANGTWNLFIRDDNGAARTEAPEVVLGEVKGGWGIELLPSTAAGVEVSGRVLTPDGRGLRNAQVTITDSMGNQRTATTGSFGHYRFEDVEIGSSYVMGVTSNRYRYSQRLVQVFDTLTEVDFTPQE